MTQPIETLKIWPEFFQAYLEGRKPFEIRRQDRPFEVGYLFRFKEWDPEALGLAREAHDCLVLGNRPEAQVRLRELCNQLTVALGGA